MNKQTETIKPITKCLMTIGQLPSSYLISMTYEEQLLWLCNFLKTEVIPKTNENIEAVNQLIQYIEDYFDNLDIQEEVNIKLEEMVESGQLQEIIGEYLNTQALITFNTLSDLKSATNLINGSKVKTLGYHTINDGGGATYFVREVTNQDTENDMDIIALYDNTLVAEIVINDYINPAIFGAYGDNDNDDTIPLQFAINKAYSLNIPIKLSTKTYKITDTLILPEKILIDGNDGKIYLNDNKPILQSNIKMNSSIIQNLNLQGAGNDEYTDNVGIYFAGIYCIFENMNISYCYNGIYQYSDNIDGNEVTCKFNNLNIRYISNNAMELGETSNGKVTDGWLTNLNIGCKNIGIRIGSAKGYYLSNIHFWGDEETNISLRDTSYTFINKIYSEGFKTRALSVHLLGDVYINNCSLNLNTDSTTAIYFARSTNAVQDIYAINMDNIVVNRTSNTLTGTFIDSENKAFPNVKITNVSIAEDILFTTYPNVFKNPNLILKTKEKITCDSVNGNTYIIPIPLELPNNNYYKCRITLYGRRYDYSTFNASAIYDAIISQGGSTTNANITLMQISAPNGFNENPTATYSKTDKQITLSFKTNNSYPLCIFVEWFKEA